MKDNKDKCLVNFYRDLNDDNRGMKYCFIQGPKGLKGDKGDTGPTGPRGENGPTTIEIGITETGEPDTESLVTNVGTDKNVILNFKIPRGSPGVKGEKGDVGPRGLPGEIGISEVITIDGTETVEADEPAEVLDDFDRNIHHLTFYIPKGEQGIQGLKGDAGPRGDKGEQGDVGPKGDAGGISAYGERYSNMTQRFNVVADNETIIPLEQTGPALFTGYDTAYSIDIKKTGFYQINYFLNVATSTDTNYVVKVKNQDNDIPASDIECEAQANVISKVCGTVIYGLLEDDELSLSIRTDQDTELIFDGSTSAKLSIIKLD